LRIRIVNAYCWGVEGREGIFSESVFFFCFFGWEWSWDEKTKGAIGLTFVLCMRNGLSAGYRGRRFGCILGPMGILAWVMMNRARWGVGVSHPETPERLQAGCFCGGLLAGKKGSTVRLLLVRWMSP